uniref:NUDE domain-containing protein n=1 Tax=Timema poppense TaxID=170557 RepID=A0A7R9DJP5_TIMPO|nr:unnamed protein product [Timema poppensis]
MPHYLLVHFECWDELLIHRTSLAPFADLGFPCVVQPSRILLKADSYCKYLNRNPVEISPLEILFANFIHVCRLDDARDEKRQVERDLEEFQENSQQLEKELETSLEQAEKTTRDLRTRNNRLQLDNDTIRDKFEHLQRQSNMQILELQTSVSEYNNRQETLVKYIRELEQKNDDLERANRAMMTSLGESETKLNTAIERNAILEVEQDETKSILQRLKDESRDLLQEMKIRGPQVPDNDKSLERVCSPIDSNKLTVEIQTQTGIPGSPLKSKLNKAYRRTRDVGRALSCVGCSAH